MTREAYCEVALPKQLSQLQPPSNLRGRLFLPLLHHQNAGMSLKKKILPNSIGKRSISLLGLELFHFFDSWWSETCFHKLISYLSFLLL